jgi:hypothetical protein
METAKLVAVVYGVFSRVTIVIRRMTGNICVIHLSTFNIGNREYCVSLCGAYNYTSDSLTKVVNL